MEPYCPTQHATLASVPPRTGEDVDDAVLLEVAVVVEAAAALPRTVKAEHVAKVEVQRQEPPQDRLGTEAGERHSEVFQKGCYRLRGCGIHATLGKSFFASLFSFQLAPDAVPLVEVLLSEEVDDRGELELDRDWDHLLVPGIHV